MKRSLVYFCRTVVFLGATGLLTFPGSHRTALAGGQGKAYFTEAQANTVGVLDSRSNKVLKRISVPKGAHGVAITPDGSRAFVSSDESNIISVIDTKSDEIVGTIPTGKQPHGLLTGRDGRHIFAAIFGDDQVLEIDARSLKVVKTFDAPSPHNLAQSPDGNVLYFAAQKKGATGIGRIDLQSGTVKELIKTETVPRALGISPDGATLCATLFDKNEVEFYSTSPLKQIASVGVGGSPHHVLFTTDGKHVLVVNQLSNDLFIIDPETHSVAGKVAVGRKPHWIALTADSKYAYVTDEASNEISLVDLIDKDVEQTITVGAAPRKIALQTNSSERVTISLQGPPPRFVPETVRIAPGTTVEWVNNGRSIHTVTDDGGQWDSGSMGPGEKYTRTFSRKGTFPYHCTPHAEMGMVGTIVVE